VPAKSIFSGARTFIFSAMPFDENPFTWQCEKEQQKDLRVSNFAILWVIFK